MNALTSYVSYISGYIPATVKDRAGLNPQISQDVRHITWLSVERVFWPPRETLRFFLVLGYVDGFQIWDLQDPASAIEVVSKQDKPVTLVRLLPVPLVTSETAETAKTALGMASAPLLAYLHRGAPALVRLFSLQAHDDVHLLRLTEPARSLQASRRYFAVGLTRQVDIYDSLHFQQLFSVNCAAAASSPTFALGHRWLAYNLPPLQPYAAGLGPANLLAVGVRNLPSLKDGVQYLGQMSQKTFDAVLMPPPDGADQASTQAASRCGIIAVRDAGSRAVIAQFEDHTEAIDMMAWDPSGLQLVSCGAQGHQILVHRALLGAEHTLMTHDSEEGGLAVGSVVFQHLFTLSRGYTPAVISDISISDDGQFVAVCSAIGTTHVFRLPPLHCAALGRHSSTGAVRLSPTQACASSPPGEMGIGLRLGGGSVIPKAMKVNATVRVKLGSALLREGLLPKCGFLNHLKPSASGRSTVLQSRSAYPRMYIATRAGSLALYSLCPPNASSSAQRTGAAAAPANSVNPASFVENTEWQAMLAKEDYVCRLLRHFSERRLSSRDFGLLPSRARDASQSSRSLDAGGGMAGAWYSPTLRPQSSPSLGPRPAPSVSPASSPALGPRASPLASPGLGPRASPPASPLLCSPRSSGSKEDSSSFGTETQKWLSHVETSTHVAAEVPVWISPQLSFHAYPSCSSAAELNTILREGGKVLGRRRLVISRPERLGDGVRYANPQAADGQLAGAFDGAIGSAMGEPLPETSRLAAVEQSKAAPAMALAPAWGALGGREEEGDAQVEGIGDGLKDVEEDWLQA